jgi:hypothetical protein
MPQSYRTKNLRLARFILQPSVASRRYLFTFWNPRSLGGSDVINKNGKVIQKSVLKPGATPEDVARYDEVVAANDGETRVMFRSKANMGPDAEVVAYTTGDPIVAAWLRTEIRAGRLKAREDVTASPLACPWCDFQLPTGSPSDHETMYRHHLDQHPERLNDMVGEPLEPAPVVA